MMREDVALTWQFCPGSTRAAVSSFTVGRWLGTNNTCSRPSNRVFHLTENSPCHHELTPAHMEGLHEQHGPARAPARLLHARHHVPPPHPPLHSLRTQLGEGHVCRASIEQTAPHHPQCRHPESHYGARRSNTSAARRVPTSIDRNSVRNVKHGMAIMVIAIASQTCAESRTQRRACGLQVQGSGAVATVTCASANACSSRPTSHVKGLRKNQPLLVALLVYTMMPSADR